LQSNRNKTKSNESKSIYRTCEEIRNAEPDSPSGDYWIDPDGAGYGDVPILVNCLMTTGISFKFTDVMPEIAIGLQVIVVTKHSLSIIFL
jgi:Fibrillar collagen C-terminal domain